jgi:hypothetical protein
MIKEKLIIESIKMIEIELKKEIHLNTNEIDYVQKKITEFNAILEVLKTNIK